ncbi:putative C6 transcription factor [Cladophialophora carrionii]|uniref:Putative C6 transcription factor n=1 Tax=Cladophialophora carrionii TaxID=86049 RepID=A0A1C1CK71_9EURO|nr:putative C6 transcription factor [Cladophialophora carrionii]
MIRQCVELGLHRQVRTDRITAQADEFKRRLFWSIYHLERRIVLVLGRPLAISDDEIDIPFPCEISDDSFEDSPDPPEISRGSRASDPKSRPGAPSIPARNDVLFHIHNIMLDQLNAKSRLTLSRLAKVGHGTKIEQKIAKRFQELEDWKNRMFGHSAGGDGSMDLMLSTSRTPVQTPASRLPLPEAQRLVLLLNYHRARRMLLQTMLTEVKLPNRAFPFSSFARSSGEVCQLNRRLHRLGSVPFTLLDLHSVFVAGFSMIYCAWSDPGLYDAEMAADLGACSTVLYLVAEQWGAGAKKYRDAFELIMGKTAEYIPSLRRSHESSQPPPVSVHFQSPLRAPVAVDDTVLGAGLPQPTAPYDVERRRIEGWTKDSIDVWQMMSEFAESQDGDLECDPVNFQEIEAFLEEEGLGWFNGGTSSGF